MTKLVRSLLILLPLLALAVPLAGTAAPMSNDDVIRMVKGGLGEATVIQAINAAEPRFDTSPDGLVKLKQEGVDDKIIQHIIHLNAGAPATHAVAPACPQCGTVTGIREIEKPRKYGAGTATGAALGGLLGYAAGGHNHRAAGTVVGVAGGAVAGNMIENRAGANNTFEIGVLFDDGSTHVFHQDSHPGWSQGSRVRLSNGALNSL